jgi:hypothetical protein
VALPHGKSTMAAVHKKLVILDRLVRRSMRCGRPANCLGSRSHESLTSARSVTKARPALEQPTAPTWPERHFEVNDAARDQEAQGSAFGTR